ncbi:tripartite tricarboxylate transporter TctB family protein [Micrococcales bacterium 31B]|nr:tripartite tricarboxylate transporter TctB family protein [Micrococcales bacterium 31B]
MSAARAYFKGRSEVGVAALLAAIGVLLAIGTFTMDVAGDEGIGPQFFPYLVAALLVGVGIALGAQVLLRRGAPAREDDLVPTNEFSTDMLEDLAGEHHHADGAGGAGGTRASGPGTATLPAREKTYATHTDWRTVGLVVAGLAAFAALLNVLGFVLAAAGLFWLVCFAFGSKRPIFDIAVGVIVSSILQLAFGLGLGLALPAGFFGVIFGGGA